MIKKPVRATKNSILQAVRTQRKSKKEITWYVIGVMRDGVPPTAVIVGEHLLFGDRVFYDRHEYDIIEKVEDYDEYRKIRQLKNQEEVVNFIAHATTKWETFRRKERQAIEQEPIRYLLSKHEVTEYEEHYKGDKLLFSEEEVDYGIGEFSVDYLLHHLATYQAFEHMEYDENRTSVIEDRVEILYIIDIYQTNTDEYTKEEVFKLTIPVNEQGLVYKDIKFDWLLKEGMFGLSGTVYKSDPVYKYIMAIKRG